MTSMPPISRMRRALSERDPAFQGVFVVGVRTTGIFCKPSCPARRPRPVNCVFFATCGEAILAGFRPCRRCHPLDPGRPASKAVARLLERVATDPLGRIPDPELRALGIDPTTARRGFKRHTGLTFRAYQRACRIARAVDGLSRGTAPAQAAAQGGYQSFSGFGEAVRKVAGASPSRVSARGVLVSTRIETPLGPMVAVADESGLWILEFADRRALARELVSVRTRAGSAILPGRNAVIDQVASELADYFAGRDARFRTPLHLRGSDFQVRVWNALLAIPAGRTRSYGEIAAAIGAPAAVRAVGRANGENVLAIVVPCHRVIRADGTLSGYGGGIWRKRRLLEHEAAMRPELTASVRGRASARPAPA